MIANIQLGSLELRGSAMSSSRVPILQRCKEGGRGGTSCLACMISSTAYVLAIADHRRALAVFGHIGYFDRKYEMKIV